MPEILNGGRRVCPRTAPPGGGGGGIFFFLGRFLRGRNFTRREFTMTPVYQARQDVCAHVSLSVR